MGGFISKVVRNPAVQEAIDPGEFGSTPIAPTRRPWRRISSNLVRPGPARHRPPSFDMRRKIVPNWPNISRTTAVRMRDRGVRNTGTGKMMAPPSETSEVWLYFVFFLCPLHPGENFPRKTGERLQASVEILEDQIGIDPCVAMD